MVGVIEFLTVLFFFGFIGTAVAAVVQWRSIKKPKSAAILAGVSFVSFIATGVLGNAVPSSLSRSSTKLAQAAAHRPTSTQQPTDSPEARDSAEPTDAPTPGPCDVRRLRQLDAKPGADILAGTDPGVAINAAADAENDCSRSLDGEQAYRHILAAGDLYLLGIHADDANDKEGFMQYAIATVHVILSAPDASPATRAKAKEIIDAANEKLRSWPE